MYGVPPMKLSKKVSKMILFKAFLRIETEPACPFVHLLKLIYSAMKQFSLRESMLFLLIFFFNNTNNVSFFPLKAVPITSTNPAQHTSAFTMVF